MNRPLRLVVEWGPLVLTAAMLVTAVYFVFQPAVPKTYARLPPPTVEQCHTVYADSFDIRGAVIEGELDVFDALQLGPDSYRKMVLEAYQTEMTTGAFSARWLGMCLAGRIQPREVE